MQGTVLHGRNDSAVDWTVRMERGERELAGIQARLNRLQGHDEETCVRRTVLMNGLRERTLRLHAFLEDCLCGRNSFEQALMRYKIRIEYPLFSQMDMVFSLGSSDPVPPSS